MAHTKIDLNIKKLQQNKHNCISRLKHFSMKLTFILFATLGYCCSIPVLASSGSGPFIRTENEEAASSKPAKSEPAKSEPAKSKPAKSNKKSKTGKNGKDGGELKELLKVVKFHPEPENPLIFTIEKNDGTFVALYGDKDENGKLLQVTAARMVDTASGTSAYAEYDDQGRPLHIVSPNGDVFNIVWHSSSKLSMEFMSSDGTSQVFGTADLNNAQNVTSSFAEAWNSSRPHESFGNQNARQLSLDYGTYTISNRKCGGLADDDSIRTSGFLDIMLTSPNGDTQGTLQNPSGYGVHTVELYPFHRVSQGQYVAHFPVIVEDWDTLALREMCQDVTFAISFACSLFSEIPLETWTLMCARILSTAPSLPTLGAAAICESAYPIAYGLCNSGLIGTPMIGPDSLLQNLCDLITVDAPIKAAKVDACLKHYNRFATSNQLSGCAPGSVKTALAPNFQISYDFNDEDEPSLFWVDVTPQDPLPHEDVLVTAAFGCVTGTVRIHVDGSDGYEDEVICDDLNQSVDTCILKIPGGAASVKDVINFYYDQGLFSFEKKWPRETTLIY